MNDISIKKIGFIGLGVMGGAMCSNLLKNKNWSVLVKDLDFQKEKKMEKLGALISTDFSKLFKECDVIITCLPGGAFVRELFFQNDFIKQNVQSQQYIIDMSTSQPDLMVDLDKKINKQGAFFADAPIARTRQAAIDGTLAIMVGSNKKVYKHILPILKFMGNDIMYCGTVGSGQLTKIMNNMILFETVVALSEAASITEKYGMSVKTLFENITKCSGDSFALRNHGLKSIAEENYPSPAFSVEYALKDLSYALELGEKHKVSLPGAKSVETLFAKSIKSGNKDLYFPVIKKNLS